MADAAMDNALNVYVTGPTSQSPGYDGYDITTIKYNKYGASLWTTHCNVYGYQDRSYSICLDANGNAYVAGYTKDGNNNERLVVIKYNGTNGNIEWCNSDLLQEPGYYNYKIAVDNSNNVYVATCRTEASLDFWLLKLNGATGQLIWDEPLDQGGNEVWRDMVLDAAGNIYVAGTRISGWTERVFTAKYLPNGNTKWVEEYNLVETEGCDGIDIDNYGNVYVSGTSRYSTSISHPIVLKYTERGQFLWVYHYPSQNSTGNRDIEVYRPSGESYITGSVVESRYNKDVYTTALDTDGNLLWHDEYGAAYHDIGRELGVTTNCVYVSGYSTTAYDEDILTLCYQRQTGGLLWAETYDYGDEDISYNVAVRKKGRYAYIVAAGYKRSPNEWTTLMYSYWEPDWGSTGPQGSETQFTKPFFFEKPYPNPTRDVVNIRFNSLDERRVMIQLYDATGRLIKSIFNGYAKIGVNEITYIPQHLPNGIYFVKLDADGYHRVEKVIYQK